MPLLELRSVSFSYDPAAGPLLKEIDLSLSSGQRIGLIGPNGQGKTTLLHLCVGLLQPREGSVLFRGEPARDRKRLRELRRSIGLVFQNPEDQLFSPTVLEDVAFGPLNLGHSPGRAREIAERTLQAVGLQGFEHRITHKLSGGEKRLLSIATILAMDPEAMLLDEPAAGLDPETREKLVHILNGLDVGMLVVSHDWDFLDRTVGELRVLQRGELQPTDKAALHRHVHYHPSGEVPHEHKNGLQKDREGSSAAGKQGGARKPQ
jgi:cobalt/nickel transport system ATP-binding protein